MKKTIRLTESDLTRIVKRVINEETGDVQDIGNNARECGNEYIDSFMKTMMGDSNNFLFTLKTIPKYEELLLLTDPSGKECYCKKEKFASLGGI